MATLAPSAARRFAIAAPIPREPPVTTATLPANFCPLLLFICFALSLFLFVSLSGLASETDVVVQFDGVKPCFDVLAGLAEFPDIFGKKLERFGVAVWSAFFHVGGPGFDFPRRAPALGMRPHPFEDFPVAFSFSQFLQKSFGIETKKPDKVLVRAGIIFVFAIHPGEGRPAFVEHAGQDDQTAQANMEAARWALS